MDFLWKGEVSTAEINVNDELRKQITDAQQKDEDMQKVFKAIKEGGDLRKSLDGDERIGQMVIPKSMVHEILQRAHFVTTVVGIQVQNGCLGG